MKIAGGRVTIVSVAPDTHWVFLTLETDRGVEGHGEALLGGREPALADALERAAARLVGSDALAATAPPARLADEGATGLLEATVRSTLDQCLWDLRSRHAGIALQRMLGPTLRREIPLYANINRGTRERSPEGFAARAREAAGDGFAGVKIAPFDGFSRRTAHTGRGQLLLQEAVERVRAVRDAIGFDVMLMVDCHCRLDLPAALQFLDATAELRLDWFEDVLPYHDLDGWERLRAQSRAPLAGGETARGVRDLLPFVTRGLWDVLMPDVRFFGVTELVALGPLAVQHQVTISPHNPRGPIATLASAHAMAGCAAFHLLEYQYGECPWRASLAGGGEVVDRGALRVPDGPGLGVALDRSVAAEHPYAPGATHASARDASLRD